MHCKAVAVSGAVCWITGYIPEPDANSATIFFSINSFLKLLFFVAARPPPPADSSKTSIFQQIPFKNCCFLRPWAPKLVFCIRKLLQFNDFVSDRSPTPAVRFETYVFLSFFFFNLLFFRFGPVPDNDGVNVMRYICMFIVNPSQIPSRVQ